MIFGVLLTASGIIALTRPEKTFARFADILGLGVPDDRDSLDGSGVHRAAFARRVVARPDQRQPDGLTGLLGERPFFLTRTATLLVFAVAWALVKGITDIVRAFQLRQLG